MYFKLSLLSALKTLLQVSPLSSLLYIKFKNSELASTYPEPAIKSPLLNCFTHAIDSGLAIEFESNNIFCHTLAS